MNETTQSANSSSETLSRPGLKSVALKVWELIKPYLAGLSLLLGALSALYISGVTNGSTSRALDVVEHDQRVDREKITDIVDRISKIETTQSQVGTLTESMILLAKEQGELNGTVSGIDQNVRLLLDALLRGPRQGSAPLQPVAPAQR